MLAEAVQCGLRVASLKRSLDGSAFLNCSRLVCKYMMGRPNTSMQAWLSRTRRFNPCADMRVDARELCAAARKCESTPELSRLATRAENRCQRAYASRQLQRRQCAHQFVACMTAPRPARRLFQLLAESYISSPFVTNNKLATRVGLAGQQHNPPIATSDMHDACGAGNEPELYIP